MTRKLFKFVFNERTHWMWLHGCMALFSDNWDGSQVDTSDGYHLYIVNTDTGVETPYAYSGAATFFPRVLTSLTYHEDMIKHDVMNTQIVLVTRIRDVHGNSK